MYARVELRHTGLPADALVGLLDLAFASMRVADHRQALSESRPFASDADRYLPHVVYAYRPRLTALALCFRQTDIATEFYVQASERPLLFEVCGQVVNRVLGLLNHRSPAPNLTSLELYEDNGESVGITATTLEFKAVLAEIISRERIFQGVVTAVMLSSVSWVGLGVSLSALTATVTVASLVLFALVSSAWKWHTNRNRLRWHFNGA